MNDTNRMDRYSCTCVGYTTRVSTGELIDDRHWYCVLNSLQRHTDRITCC